MPFLLVYLHRVRGIGLAVAGLALATIALASLGGNPTGGWLADRAGSRRALVFGLLLAATGSIGVALVHSTWQAFAATGLLGFGAGVVWPSQDALMASLVAPEQRSQVFAVRHATLNAGLGLGGVAAALVVSFSSPASFVLIYLLDAASYAAFVPIVLTMSRTGDRSVSGDDKELRGGYRMVIRDRVFVRIWILTALLILAGYGQYHAAFPAYATGPGRLSARALGVVFAANTFAVVLVQLVVLKLLSGRRRTRGVMGVCAFWAGTWAITLLAGGLRGGGAALAGFIVAMVLFAVGETLLSPTIPAMVNDLAPEHLRGRYNGAYTLAWTTGFLLGPALGGLALGTGHGRTLFIGLIALLGLIALGAHRLEARLPAAVNRVGRSLRPESAVTSTPGGDALLVPPELIG